MGYLNNSCRSDVTHEDEVHRRREALLRLADAFAFRASQPSWHDADHCHDLLALAYGALTFAEFPDDDCVTAG